MTCFYHINTQAVAQCHICQKGVCGNCCYIEHGRPTCRSCALNAGQQKAEKRANAVRELLMIVISFIIAKYIKGFLNIEGDKQWLFLWVCTGFPAGWSFLGADSPKPKRVIATDHFIFEIAFKFVLSLIVGAFILPFKIVSNVYLLIRNI